MADPVNPRLGAKELLELILRHNPQLTPEDVFEMASLIGYDFVDVPEAEKWRRRKNLAGARCAQEAATLPGHRPRTSPRMRATGPSRGLTSMPLRLRHVDPFRPGVVTENGKPVR